MTDSGRRYKVNYDWLWGRANRNMCKIAPLSIRIQKASPELLERLLRKWLGELDGGCEGTWYYGGWEVADVKITGGTAILTLSSSGEDVAESLQHAADTFYERVLEPLESDPTACGVVTWVELPLRKAPRE